jgi:hypothetical protein
MERPFLKKKISSAVAPLQAAVGTNEAGEPVKVDDRLRTIMGQNYPMVAAGARWPMANRALFERLQTLDKARAERGLVIDALKVQVDSQAAQLYPFENQDSVLLTHNRGRYVGVTCYDQDGNQVDGSLSQPDLNTIQLIFSQPLSGTVVLT